MRQQRRQFSPRWGVDKNFELRYMIFNKRQAHAPTISRHDKALNGIGAPFEIVMRSSLRIIISGNQPLPHLTRVIFDAGVP